MKPIRRIRSAACLVVLAACLAAGDAPGDDAKVAALRSAMAAADPAARLRALDEAARQGLGSNWDLMTPIVQGDADLGVRLRALEVMARGQPSEKYSDRIAHMTLGRSLRGDHALLLPFLEVLVRVYGAGKTRDNIINRVGAIIAEFPFPAVPTSGTVQVEVAVTIGSVRKVTKVVVDAAGARAMRANYAKALAILDRIAQTGLDPEDGPAALAAWLREHGGQRMLAAEQWDILVKSGRDKGREPSLPAAVVSAGFLGGPGTEWLAGVGVLGDGRIVVAGTALGPGLTLAGVAAQVLGNDRPPPAEVIGEPELRRGKPVVGADGKPVLRRLLWSHPQGTAFVAVLGADLRVQSVRRFPWGLGGASDVAVAPDGSIYVAGPVFGDLAALGAPSIALPASQPLPDTGRRRQEASNDPADDKAESAYLVKLSGTADRVLWSRTVRAPTDAPRIRLHGDDVILLAGDLRVLDRDGRQREQRTLPDRIDGCVDVRPRDLAIVRGGETPWATGHEPWRDPWIWCEVPSLQRPLKLYHFDGPFAGGAGGLVSDSVVKVVAFDPDGDIVFGGWSDGGNSVFRCEPLDMQRPAAGMQGRGLSGMVSGATSVAWVVRVSTKTWRVTGGAMLNSSLASNGIANGMRVDGVHVAANGSLIVNGVSGWGLPFTRNHIGTGMPAGQYVMITDPTMRKLRFCSALPGCAEVQVGPGHGNPGGTTWGVRTAEIGGRTLALMVTGAAEAGTASGWPAPTPQARPVQPAFGGGRSDGYLLVIDITVPAEAG